MKICKHPAGQRLHPGRAAEALHPAAHPGDAAGRAGGQRAGLHGVQVHLRGHVLRQLFPAHLRDRVERGRLPLSKRKTFESINAEEIHVINQRLLPLQVAFFLHVFL